MRWWFVLCVVSWAGAQEPTNLLPNADLEAPFGEGGLPTGWHWFAGEAGAYRAGVAEPGRDSARAWRVAGQGGYAGMASDPRPLRPDRRFLAVGWVKVTGAGRATVKLDYTAGGKYHGSDIGGFVRAGEGWREVRVADHRSGAPGAETVAFACAFEGDGEAQFDDLYFAELPPFGDEAGNLLANGPCETGVGDAPLWFNLFAAEGSRPTALWRSEAARTGQRGLTLKADREWAVWQHEPLVYDPTRQYVLTGWIRSRSGRAFLKFDYVTADAWLGQQPTVIVEPNGEWVQVKLTADPRGFPGLTKLAVAAVVEGAGSEADFDDLRLVAQARE